MEKELIFINAKPEYLFNYKKVSIKNKHFDRLLKEIIFI